MQWWFLVMTFSPHFFIIAMNLLLQKDITTTADVSGPYISGKVLYFYSGDIFFEANNGIVHPCSLEIEFS
jgi:hypothetical protein